MTGEGFDIILVTNSPGELSVWVQQVAREMRSRLPESRIIVSLVPCPFASGKEYGVARSYSYVNTVLSPADYFKLAFPISYPPGYRPAKHGVVVFLGGDYWHGSLLAHRLGWPAIAYATRPSGKGLRKYNKIFCSTKAVQDTLLSAGIPEEKTEVAGHLLVEGVEPLYSRQENFNRCNLDGNKPTLGVFPGSRLYNVEDSLPVFLKVCDEVREKIKEVQFLLGVSPFVRMEELERFLLHPSRKSGLPGVPGKLFCREGIHSIVTAKGTEITVLKDTPYDMILMSDVVLTIPGTNTGECAVLGKPAVVALSWRARVPSAGAGYFLNLIPPCSLRKSIMHRVFRKITHASLPNILANRTIVPEVRIEKESSEITPIVTDLLTDKEKREQIGKELRLIMGKPGAVSRICGEINKTCEKSGTAGI